MRTLSEIYSEKRRVAANLKKAGLWCAGGFVITILSLLVSSHFGFSIITLGAIGWGGWNVYKCLKRLDELENEENKLKSHIIDGHLESSKLLSKSTTSSTIVAPSSGLRSRTWGKELLFSHR